MFIDFAYGDAQCSPSGCIGKQRHSNHLIADSILRKTNPSHVKCVRNKSQWYHPGSLVALSSAARRSMNPRHREAEGPGVAGPQRIQ